MDAKYLDGDGVEVGGVGDVYLPWTAILIPGKKSVLLQAIKG